MKVQGARFAFSIALCAVALAGLALSACNKAAKPATAAKKTPPAVELQLALLEGKPASGSKHAASLSYSVNTPSGASSMRLVDPKRPEGATVELEQATIRIHPFICQPKILRAAAQQAKVDGCYTLCVRDKSGLHIGDFEINDLGALILKNGTPDDSIEVESISTMDRSVFFAYDKLPAGGKGALRFGLEYIPGSVKELDVVGSDGWNYAFNSPDGRLVVYDPLTIQALPEQMRALAQDQQRTLAAVYEEMRQARERANSACRTGGG